MSRTGSWSPLILVVLILVDPLPAASNGSGTAASPVPVSIHQLELERGYPDLLPVGGIPPRRLPWRETRVRLARNLVGFIPYWLGDSWQQIPSTCVTHLCWFALELSPTGDIAAYHGWPDGPLVDHFHAAGLPVLVTAALFGATELNTLLGSGANRANARANLVAQMRTGDADGVMIDFEQLPAAQYWTMLTFMSDLRGDLDQAGLEDGRNYRLQVCTPAVDWSGSYGYSGLSDICEALFIMGYNYHWSGSATTGPVSPAIGWGAYNVTWSIQDHLNYNGNRPEKLVLGLPWYGYDWPCVSDQPAAATTGSGTARIYAEAREMALELGWQRETTAQTPWSPYLDGGWRQCWHEDTVSLGMKLDLLETYDLQGGGVWALGYQGGWDEVWVQIEQRLGETPPPGIDDLQISLSDDSVLLSWSPLPGASAYMLHASPDPYFTPGAGTLIATQTETSFTAPVSEPLRFFRVVGVME